MATIVSDLVVANTVLVHRLVLDAPFEIWRIDLSRAPDEAGTATLSQAELQRAERFRHARDARRYLAAHAGMRHIMEEYSGVAAADQRFTHNSNGKPALVNPGNWQFNISYAGDVALLALDFDRALGIDVELNRSIADADDLAALHFTDSERDALSKHGADRSRAFLCGWTRKEACLKAWGTGLQRAPNSVGTGLDPATITVLLDDAPPVTVGSFQLDGLIGAWACV